MRIISDISLLLLTLRSDSPRVLHIFPFMGYTPKISRSCRLSPDTTPALAESPSHSRSIHLCELELPARFASTSLWIPRMLLHLDPLAFFASLFSLACAMAHATSITPIFAIFLTKSSETSQVDPNALDGVFM